MDTSELIKIDNAHLIHPNHPIGEDCRIVIESGDGIWLQDTEGKRYIDGRSQLCCVNLGYGHKEIVNAIKEQLEKLQYLSIFYNFSHPTIIECSTRLAEVTPDGLNHFFFTSGGSESIESGLMFARLFWHLKEKPKHKIISLYMSYHGNTLGATSATGMEMGGLENMSSLCPGFIHIPPYYCYRCFFGKEYPSCGIKCAHFLADIIEREGPDSVSTFIAEPILGVGGYISPPPEYWPIIRKICNNYDIILFADEVMTGFCRTGKYFALENWGVISDLMAMGKGINSSYVPFGAVALNDNIYETLKGNHVSGFTHSGNPLGAAAACKALEIYSKEKIADHTAQLGSYMLERLNKEFKPLPCVADVNGLGLMIGIELVKDKNSKEPLDKEVMAKVLPSALANGLITRGRGTRIALCPPLIISKEEADKVLDILYPIIAELK